MRLLYAHGLDLPAPVAAPIQILRTARALADRGVEVTTAWRSVGDVDDVLAGLGIGPHPGLRLVEQGGWPGLRRLAEDADVVMARGEHGVRAFAALTGRRPFVYEAHRPVVSRPRALGWFRGPSATRLERRAARGGAGRVSVSRGVLDELRTRHGAGPPELVLPSGTDPPPGDADPPRDLEVIYAGKLERRKGLGVLLDAMGRLPGVQLTVLGGSESERAALTRAAEAGGTRVDAVGWVEPAAVRGWLRRARVGVCPLPTGVSDISERYTSPMKIVEMMACGTPIVASDLPSVREILFDGRNAVLVPPSDPAALASAIRSLLDRPKSTLVERARRDAEALTWDRRAEKLQGFLAGLPV